MKRPNDLMEVERASTSRDRECDICHEMFIGDRGLNIHKSKKHNKKRRDAVEHSNDTAHPDNATSTATEAMDDEDSPTIEAVSPQTLLPSRDIEWGDMKGIQEIKHKIEATHQKIIVWQKNTFEPPRNSTGKDLIKELTRLINLYNSKTVWEPVALHLVTIFLPIMLQKPSSRSKNCDHSRYLKQRLDLWKKGNLNLLLSECEEIQKRLKNGRKKEEAVAKGFTHLMMEGKVRKALKLIDADSLITGVLSTQFVKR